MALTPSDFAGEIQATLDAGSKKLNRDFFAKLLAGKLSRDGLQRYYLRLYQECSTFVRLLSAVHFQAETRQAREFMAENLTEEYAGGDIEKSHPCLARRVGESVGLSREQIETHETFPELRSYFGELAPVATASFVEGCAMLLAWENELPVRHARMRDALVKHYGVDDANLGYYHAHMTLPDQPGYGGDEVHARREIDLLVEHARTPEQKQKVKDAILRTFEARDRLVRAYDQACGSTT
jgi:pyrroloquinoline quinone (PQQ) biosynthesis protein C